MQIFTIKVFRSFASLFMWVCVLVQTEWRIWKSNVRIFRWVCYVFLFFFWYFSFLDHIFSSDPITVYTGFNLFGLDTVIFFFTIDFFFFLKRSPPLVGWSFYGLGSVFSLFLMERNKKWADNERSAVFLAYILHVFLMRSHMLLPSVWFRMIESRMAHR